MQAPEAHDSGVRHPFLWAALVYGVAALSLGYPALGGGFLVTPVSDQFIGGYPVREFAAQMLREHHQFPLWSPYIFGGMPYVAAMHGDIFYPTFLLRMLLPTDVAMTWSFIIHFFLAGLLTFGFLRICGLGFFASLIGGLAYMMSGNIAGLVSPGHDGKLYISALLPLCLWLLVIGVREGKAWVWGALCIVFGLAVLTPHPQLLQYMLLGAGAFAAYLAFGPWPGARLPRPVALRRLACGLGAVVVGFAIGAIQYVPVLEYVAWSPRAGGVGGGYATATSYSYPPEEIINAYLPQFSGILNAYWGGNNIHLHSDYIGVVVLLLAAAAFGAKPRLGKTFIWFWTGVLGVALLWAMGGYTPFYNLIYAVVPGTKFFRAPSTMLFMISFSICVLAAVGVERLLGGEISRRYLTGWVIGAAVVALLASAGLFTGIGSMVLPDRAQFVRENAGAVTLGAWRSFVFVVLGAGVLYGAALGRFQPNVTAMLLCAVVGADLWSIEHLYWRFSPPAAQLYAADATIEYLKRQPQPGRVLPLPTQSSSNRDPFLTGDGLMVHGIRNALGYHGNHLANYEKLTGPGMQRVGEPRFWQLANVKFLLSDKPGLGPPVVAGPVRNAYGTTVYLYQLPGENPAAWVTPVIVKAGDDQVVGTLYHERFDPKTAALFDTAAAVKGRTDLKEPPQPLSLNVTVKQFEPGHISLELDKPAPAGAALVVSENFYPGWQASVDGKPATVGRADVTLIGVELPEGGKSVDLRFTSRPYERGRMITLVSLAFSVILLGAGLVLGRKTAPLAGAGA